MRIFDAAASDFETSFDAFLAEPRGRPADVDAAVRTVLEAVRTGGMEAVLAFSRQFDGADLTLETVRVSKDEIEAGAAACSQEVRDAIDVAAARIENYHARQRPADQTWVDEAGVGLGWRWSPLESVGVYVPGGRAAYPSTVLMNAVPARVAGVERIAMATPPGRLEPAVLAAAKAAGVTEIWRLGGAQACAALAYGAGPLKPVDKIVGPGNAYVTAAKRQLYGVVGLDALAGPSEIVVVADGAANPEWLAADLLSQAEHDPDSQAILITDDKAVAEAVNAAIGRQLGELGTSDVARASWRDHGALVIAPMSRASELVNRIAPEHVEFVVEDPEPHAAKVRHAGAIFLGRYTPEALGDYLAGSNHVLPTSGAARFSSGLSLFDFLKRTSIVRCNEHSFKALGPHVGVLADAEGLPAHARSARLRLGPPSA